ncbi:MAG: hypothetical protein HOH03_02275, partial [Candidatus Marinimicrobia bacterium]|nr:hypothetical protein [Candidatus Neomarinimicrobiota bacterium]
IIIQESSPIIQYCTIYGNRAYTSGTGISLQKSNAKIVNCTITNNFTTDIVPNDGDGALTVYTPTGYSPHITNTVIQNNQTQYELVDRTEQAQITYSNFGSKYPSSLSVDNTNINSAPLFCNADSSDFTLYDNSPCVGTGENGANIGALGVGDCGILFNGPTWHVSTDGNDFTGDGSAEFPFQHVQWSADKAISGDTIFISNGIYLENISIDGKNLHLIGESEDSVIISPQSTSQQTIYVTNVDSVVIKELSLVAGGEGAGLWAYDCAKSVLDNVSLVGFSDYGAMFSNSGVETEAELNNLTVRNNINGLNIFGTTCTIYDTKIDSNTRGIRFSSGSGGYLTLNKVRISNNSISNGDVGAGIFISQAENTTLVSIDSSEFVNNNSTNFGGAISSINNELVVSNTLFSGNYATIGGAAINIGSDESTNVEFTNCQFINNTGHTSNGSTFRTSSDTDIIDCIFINNERNLFGDGGAGSNNEISVRNSIIWNNSITYSMASNISISYSSVEEGWAGLGNISEDPLICNPYSDSFQLSSNSPCVGTGWNNANMGGLVEGCTQTVNTLYVDDDGSANGIGTINDPLQDIEKAFQRVFHEDTIYVYAGGYYPEGQISISKSVALIGEDSSLSIIHIDNMDFFQSNFSGTVNVNVVFENIKIMGSGNWESDWTFMFYNGYYLIKNSALQDIKNTYTIRVEGATLDITNTSFSNDPISFDIKAWSGNNNNSVKLNNINILQDEFHVEMPTITDSLFMDNYSLDSKLLDIRVWYFSLTNSTLTNCQINFDVDDLYFSNNIVGQCYNDYRLIGTSSDGSCYINNSLFYGNSNSTYYGLISASSFGQTLTINKSTFANNSGKLFELSGGCEGHLSNSIIQTNGYDVLDFNGNSNQSFSSSYSLIDFSDGSGWGQSGQTESNIIYDDPLFADASNDDYNLTWGSPAIDAGDPLAPLDPDSTITDMGAYYFDQSNVDIVTVSPDSLDFGTDLDTLSFLIRYVGTGDFSWSITDNPEWLTFIPSQSGSREEGQEVILPPNQERVISLLSQNIGQLRTDTRSISDSVIAIVDRNQWEVGIIEGQFTVSTDYGDNTVYVSAEKLYTGPTWHVSLDGNDFDGIGNEELPFRHIQWAVDQAASGDSILIHPGTYEENVSFENINISILGTNSDSVIITPQSTSQPTFYISNVDSVTIKQITIIGDGEGAGLYADNCSKSFLENMSLIGFSDYGAQFGNSDGETEAILKNLIIRNNSTGLNIFGTTCFIYDSQIDSNQKGINFGAGSGEDLSLVKVTFKNNETDDVGAGLYIGQADSEESIVTIDSCEFINNVSNNMGAAISSKWNKLLINNTLFIGNNALNGGSAITQFATSELIVSNCVFKANTGHTSYGSTIRIAENAEPQFINCIFIGNDGNIFGGINWNNTTCTIILLNSIIWNNEIIADEWNNIDINITYSCIEGGWAGSGNISDDPELCNPYSNSFELSDSSPCIASGWNNENMGGLAVGCTQTINTLYVDDDGFDYGTGEVNNPINNIEVGLTQLFTNDTLYVFNGEYVIADMLQLEPCTIIGEDSAGTRIISYAPNGQPLMTLDDGTAESLFRFKNLTFEMSSEVSGYTGMILYYGDIKFLDCRFLGFNNVQKLFSIGNQAGDSVFVLIENCTFETQAEDIITGSSPSSLTFRNNIIEQESFSVDYYGDLIIEDQDFSSVTVNIDPGSTQSESRLEFYNSQFYNCDIVSINQVKNGVFNNVSFNSNSDLRIAIDEFARFEFCTFNNNILDGVLVTHNGSTGGIFSIDHSTFYLNSGSALFNYSSSSNCGGTITNSIIDSEDIIFSSLNCDEGIIMTHSLINYSGTGDWGSNQVTESNMIYSDPLFINPENDDFHLQWGSPAIDSGDPDMPYDPDGTITDMGVYYYDQEDFISPTVSITSLSTTNVGTSDDVTVNWDATDNWLLDSAFVDLFYADTTYRVDTTNAESGSIAIEIPDSTLESFQIILTVWDSRQNEAKDTSSVVSVFDNTPPEVAIIVPDSGYSIPELSELTVSWIATDNIELDSVFIYFSSNMGGSFILMGGETADSNHFAFNIPSDITNNARIKLVAV